MEEIIFKIKNNQKLSKEELNYNFDRNTNILHWASFFNNIHIIKKGLKYCDINQKGGKYESTPLFFAFYNSNYLAAVFLIKNGANVKEINNLGQNVFHLTAKNDDILGHILLKCFKLSDKQKDYRNQLPIDIAYKNRSKKIIDYYEKNKKNVKTTVYNTFYALIYSYSIACLSCKYFLFLTIVFLLDSKSKKLLNFNKKVLFFLSISACFLENKEAFLLSMTLIKYFKYLIKKETPGKKKLNKHLIIKLIQKNKYNLVNYCYHCYSIKTNKRHCKYCRICFNKESYHCFFLDKCFSYDEVPWVFLCLICFIELLNSFNCQNLGNYSVILVFCYSMGFFLFKKIKKSINRF